VENSSWEANRFSSSQKFHEYYDTRRFKPATNPCAESSPCPRPISWRSILILSCHLRLGLPSDLLSGLPTTFLYAPVLSPIRATCPAHLILLDLITRIIFSEKYRSLSSSLCSFLHSTVALSHFRPKYLPQHPILEHPQSMFLPQYARASFTPIQNNRQNYSSVYRGMKLPSNPKLTGKK
jgi:hypothetical protein